MNNSSIITPKVAIGHVSRQTNLGVDSYDLDELYSPDTEIWKSKVLDIGSPKYPPQAAANPTRYWFDRSRYNNHGTITGATWRQLPSGVWVMSFDGDDYIDYGAAASLKIQNNLTNSVWFRTPAVFNTDATAFAGIETLTSRWHATSSQRSWYCALTNVENGGSIDNLVIYISQDGTTTGLYRGYYATDLVANTWYRATFTFASGVVVAYLNGSVISLTEQNSPPATLVNSTASILLSGINGTSTNPWKSRIGEIVMNNVVVSAGKEMNDYLATSWRFR